MKIAFLNIHNCIVERGSEVFVHELATHLSNSHSVTVFQTGRAKKERYTVQEIKGIKEFFHQSYSFCNSPLLNFINTRLYYFGVFVFTVKCIPYLLKEQFDWIIPINGRSQGIICRFIRFLSKKKILISGHAGIGFEDKLNIILGRPDVFVALTKKAYKWAGKISGKISVKYIPNGINTKKFSQNPEVEKLTLTKPRIMCVSALLPYKRIDLLIRAVSIIPEVSLIIIGDGPLRGEIEYKGKKLLEDKFILVPYVSHDKIVHYYNACDLFSLPSKESEAFGLAYLEAMSCNLPVVAPDDQNRRDISGEAGLYCDVEDIKRYANSLKSALSINFGNKPIIQAAKFDWKLLAKKYDEIFQNK